MLIILLLTIVFVFTIYICVRWIQLKRYWAKRHVPHIPARPIIGSFTFLQRENPAVWFRRMYNSFKNPYVGIWVFWRPGVIINSAEIARNILIKDQANFRNRFASSGTTDPIGRLNLFTLDDPLWSAIRKRITPLFTGSKLRAIQTLVTKKSKELVKRIDKERQISNSIDLRNIMTDFSTDVIGTSTFGVTSDATLTGESHLRTITKDLMKFGLFRALSWCSVFFVPDLVDFFRFKAFSTENTEYVRKILRVTIAQRGGLEKIITEPSDLLDILIKLKQDSDEEVKVTEDLMIAQATVFLQAGFESTGLTLSYAIYELAFCPQAQEKLCKELKDAKEKYGEDLLEGSILSQLVYLNCVINETLRKYPGFGWMDRVALKDYKVDEHLTIKAGTPVYINVVGMHYDPDFYPEPDNFNPDRFLSENEINIKSCPYFPFGEGPRKCIGQRMGLSSVRHGLAAVMLHYELRAFPNTPKPSDVELEKHVLFFSPGEKLSVEFVPRIPSSDTYLHT